MISHANLTKIKSEESFRVALASAEDRYQSIFSALTKLTSEINSRVNQLNEENDYILLKPNCVVCHHPNCATRPDAIKAVLDFLAPIWNGKIILAEGSADNTLEAFENYGYIKLKDEYPRLDFLDLNYSDAIFVDIFDKDLKPVTIKISNTVAEAPLRISVGPAKTHNNVVVTLSIKNMAVGSVLKEDRNLIHQGNRALNRSIAALNEYTFPHLSIIDAWQSMEGDGPIDGKMVDTKFVAVSTNPLAADTLVTQMMGFNPIQIGYLNLLGAGRIQKKIEVVGLNPQQFQFHLKPHRTYLQQINWL
ncbi:MAG: DUF362 domain-containing protein [Patescibacteria group bacterium]|jgi:uncharacterized protein (DUF362 family)